MRQREAVFADNGAWIALARSASIHEPGIVRIPACEMRDRDPSQGNFRRIDLHKLSAVDATSFALIKRARIRLAFAFDRHFFVVGFRFVA